LLLESNSGEHEDLRIGSTVGGLVLVARVADGAMGRVYEAYSPDATQRRAVKILHRSVARVNVNVERFRREFETAEYLNHPMVVKVHDFGEIADGGYYMVMDFLAGSPLAERIRMDGPFALPRALRLMCQIGWGMSHAHGEGTIHRDLKPDNVFICDATGPNQDETVCILDFGSVKLQMEVGERLTAIGTTLGSPSYMSPEQASGDRDLDQRTDVFAMAAIFYEMLSGRVAFGGDTMAEILNRVLYESAPPLTEAPDALAAAIIEATGKAKESRPLTAEAFMQGCIAALGLSISMQEVATKSLPEIEEILRCAEPVSLPPRQQGASAGAQVPASFAPSVAPVPPASVWPWVGVGAGVLLVAAVIAGVFLN